ncbi:MAG: NAD(P)-dependent glycerol-3-phosphate dehydrogenase [Gammaproteobacteria bacterium]|nr:NAD(P)-dependent glycerol-3-phosphate dehydrogenase [Gammaproteobacteria bacterium]
MTRAPTHRFAVIGAGSWGTALALLLANNGHHVRLWGRERAHMQNLHAQRANTRYLPGIAFPDNLHATLELADALRDIEGVLIAVPSEGFRECLSQLRRHLDAATGVMWATKGLEGGSRKLLHQMVQEELPSHAYAVISGPTFAKEVALRLPTAVTVASPQSEFGAQVAQWLHNPTFRAYTSNDVAGVEVGGAVKNIMAIAAGIADGLGFGANTRAALITRGLAEIQRLGVALGGQPKTFMGLAGLGDLVLTCTDNQSRNRRLGLALAAGRPVDQAILDLGQVAEGYPTAREVYALAQDVGIEMPIVEQVYQVLFHQRPPKEAVDTLLGRAARAEHG